MIISENSRPSLAEFKSLMANTDVLLNREASRSQAYFSGRNGTELEKDVFEAIVHAAVNTPFEGSIQLVSGASFPDIVAKKYFGVEVKSTNKNHWKSIGSSILESTRIQDVERIFLTFGKLGNPVSFMSRPYEECLSGISVTHYPRYQIDMKLRPGETIFDKMGIPYDVLRKMDNPVAPVSKYYKSQLKPGESLWWAADANLEEHAVPLAIRLWFTLSPDEKDACRAKGYAFFPEIMSASSPTKYNRYALWLVTNCGIVDPRIRDQFSAGGQVEIVTVNGRFENVPAAFGRIQRYRELIADTILSASESALCEYWDISSIEKNRLNQWCKLVAYQANDTIGYANAYALLTGIFSFALC